MGSHEQGLPKAGAKLHLFLQTAHHLPHYFFIFPHYFFVFFCPRIERMKRIPRRPFLTLSLFDSLTSLEHEFS